MSNPSFDYKQYVLANLPDDIEYDPKDGFFSYNGHKFPTFLQCKWYKDYIEKYTKFRTVLTVKGAKVSLFERDGQELTEILFDRSGSFNLSYTTSGVRKALAAGGATGGRSANSVYVPGGGAAGGLIELKEPDILLAGDYTVTIGAGAPRMTTDVGAANGSNSTLIGPSLSLTAIGGGFGAAYNVGFTQGFDGGSGGGGRGSSLSASGTRGKGTPGQGFDGGLGVIDAGSPASGGGGGAGGQGGDATVGVPGAAGAGVYLDWIAEPRWVCRGGDGMLATVGTASPDQEWGNGSQGAISADVGKAGDGFLILVLPTKNITVRTE